MVGILTSSFGQDSLARIRTDQILEFDGESCCRLQYYKLYCWNLPLVLIRPNRNERYRCWWMGLGCIWHSYVCADCNYNCLVRNLLYSSMMRIKVEIQSVCSTSIQKSLRELMSLGRSEVKICQCIRKAEF